MAKPTNREELIEYCLRELGAPVIEINIDDDQINDRVDDALQYYADYHGDAVYRIYRQHQITEQNIIDKFITVPDQLLFVTKIMQSGNSYAGMFSLEYQLMANEMHNLYRGGSLTDLEITKQYMSLLDTKLRGSPAIRFNRHMNRIGIDFNKGIVVGDWIVIEGYEVVDPDTYPDVYNDYFLKKYTTALLKKQFGTNLSKFDGMQLPGGVMLNGRQILDDANQEISDLEARMRDEFETPASFFVG